MTPTQISMCFLGHQNPTKQSLDKPAPERQLLVFVLKDCPGSSFCAHRSLSSPWQGKLSQRC